MGLLLIVVGEGCPFLLTDDMVISGHLLVVMDIWIFINWLLMSGILMMRMGGVKAV